MIVLSWAIRWAKKCFDFGLICACGCCSNRVIIRADFDIFWGGVTFCRFYFGMLPTQCSIQPLLYPLTAAVYPVLGHHPLLVNIIHRLPLAELQLFGTQIHSLSDPVQDEVVFALHHLVLTLYVQALQLLSWSQSWAQAHSESTVLPLTTSFPLQMKPIFLSQTKNKKRVQPGSN